MLDVVRAEGKFSDRRSLGLCTTSDESIVRVTDSGVSWSCEGGLLEVNHFLDRSVPIYIRILYETHQEQ